MYDFYGSPPQTLDDVKQYLSTWLKETDDHVVLRGWTQTHGFRRGFASHAAFRDDDGRYKFLVNTDDETEPIDMGTYDTWDEMISGVARRYCVQWNLE